MSNDSTIEKSGSGSLRIFAQIISYIFHPVFMPTMMTVILYKLSPASFAGFNVINFAKQPFPLIAPILLSTLFFPLLSILLMKGLGFIESIEMHNPKDRIIPSSLR